MTLHPTPEANVPLQDEEDTGYMSMLEAAANTAQLLAGAGLEFDTTDDDLDDAAATVRQAARAPQVLQTKVAQQGLTKKTPAALLLTASILKDYGHKVVEEASQVRHMVVNKLIQETDNPDPRIRIKALELLGKVSDVGLFTEKQEITVTHQTTGDLRARLRQKLEKLVALPDAEEAEYTDYVDVTPEESAHD